MMVPEKPKGQPAKNTETTDGTDGRQSDKPTQTSRGSGDGGSDLRERRLTSSSVAEEEGVFAVLREPLLDL